MLYALIRRRVTLLLVIFASPAFAQTTYTSSESAITALQALQEDGKNAFVVQGEIDPVIRQGGGGACASAAAIDAVQTLRLMAGIQPIANPHKATLAAIGKQDELLNGRVSNDQLTTLLKGYAGKHLEGWKLAIEVSASPNSPYSPAARPWGTADGPDLRSVAGQLKIVTFTATTDQGCLLGRHFVLLKRMEGTEMTVLDPKRPLKNITYTFTPRDIEGWGRRYFLTPPPKAKTTDVLELDSIFTLRVAKHEGSATAPDMDKLKKSINETADSLRLRGDLRSPRKWRKTSAAFGLPGLDLPPECGGSGWSACQTLEAFIQAGRHDLNCRDVVGGAHARPLLQSTHPNVLGIVRQVARGDAYMAITMTEPQVGSDFHKITSTARKVEGGTY